MSTTTLNMNLTLPTPNVDLGPAWANMLNAAFTAVDSHDHSSGKGGQINPAGININTALTFNSYDATNLRSAQMISNAATLGNPADVRCVYSVSGDLYYNNGAGVAVRITNGSSVVSGTSASPIWTPQAVSGNWTILASDTYIYLTINTSAARSITLPQASAVSAGRFYVLKDISGTSETNAISLVPNGTDTIDNANATQTLSSNYGSWIIVGNGSNGWNMFFSATKYLTTTKLQLMGSSANIQLGNTPAAAGSIRLSNGSSMSARNAANTADLPIMSVDPSNNILFASSGSPNSIQLGGAATGNLVLASSTTKITGKLLGNDANSDPLSLGVNTVAITSTSQTLTAAQYNAQTLVFTGTLTGNTNVILPTVAGYTKFIDNQCSGNSDGYSLTVKTASGQGVIIPNGGKATVYCDGTNIVSLRHNQRYLPPDPSFTVLCYSLDEPYNSLTVSSTGSNTSSLNALGNPTQVAGIHGRASWFNGTAQWCWHGAASVQPAYPIRIGFWVNPHEYNGTYSQLLVGKAYAAGNVWGNPSSTISTYLIGGGNGSWGYTITTGSNGVGSQTGASTGANNILPIGVWTHVGMTYNGSIVQLFQNGVLVLSHSTTLAIDYNTASPGDWYIGASPSTGDTMNNGECFCGLIDDVRIDQGGDVAATAQNYFSDLYRRGMGWMDNVGIGI